MSTVVDVIQNESNPILVTSSEALPIDLLNRQETIDQIMQLLNIVSDNHSSYTFALDGSWGTGKTFVLNRLMKQLLDYQDGEKFVVFHYNCWQYDYYEEPLVAIVAAMLDSVDQEKHIFSQNLREKAKLGMAAAKPILERIAKDFIEKNIGIEIKDVMALINSGAASLKEFEEGESNAYDYDKYYSFKSAIHSAKEGIRSLSQDRTVVVIVDELDRCLPNYAIKVLERLHHLFSEMENSAVVFAVDKGQLNQTVQQIFGIGTDTTKYLRKFINFEIRLDTGRIDSGFAEKYADYFAMFDNSIVESDFSFDKYFSALFAGVDARSQERIMERIKTVHMLLFPDTKKDYSFMCFEVMWLVFTEEHNLKSTMPISYNYGYEYDGFFLPDRILPEFTEYMKTEWRGIRVYNRIHHANNKPITYFDTPIDIPEILIWYLWQMYPNQPIIYQLDSAYPKVNELKQNLKELKKFSELIKIIK